MKHNTIKDNTIQCSLETLQAQCHYNDIRVCIVLYCNAVQLNTVQYKAKTNKYNMITQKLKKLNTKNTKKFDFKTEWFKKIGLKERWWKVEVMWRKEGGEIWRKERKHYLTLRCLMKEMVMMMWKWKWKKKKKREKKKRKKRRGKRKRAKR